LAYLKDAAVLESLERVFISSFAHELALLFELTCAQNFVAGGTWVTLDLLALAVVEPSLSLALIRNPLPPLQFCV
jgi:hypothetical protein